MIYPKELDMHDAVEREEILAIVALLLQKIARYIRDAETADSEERDLCIDFVETLRARTYHMLTPARNPVMQQDAPYRALASHISHLLDEEHSLIGHA